VAGNSTLKIKNKGGRNALSLKWSLIVNDQFRDKDGKKPK
jgi:hypothetical protein